MKFVDVVGQKIVKDRLVQGVSAGRIPHAQLFLGAEGSGALPLALAYAQYLLCENRTNLDSCGECGNCKKSQQWSHPDVHFSFPFPGKKGERELASDVYAQWREALTNSVYVSYASWMKSLDAENKQGNIPILECRAIIRSLSLKAFSGGYKILLMWLPEYLGKEGNVLLKLIEEPPEKTIFLLVAEDSDSVLNTIISRTQLVRIPPVEEEDMVTALIEKEGLDVENARKLAVVSAGNYCTALELIKESENPFLEPWKTLLTFAFNGRMEKSIVWAEEMSTLGREGLKSFFLYGLQLLRYSMLQPYGVGGSAWNAQEADLVKRLSGLQMGTDRIQGMVSAIENCMYEIERNGNLKMILVDVSYQVSKWIKKS